MTDRDIKKAIHTLRKQGLKDKQIIHAFINLFLNNQVDEIGLKQLLSVLKYKLPEEFEYANPVAQKIMLNEIIKTLK